jgi:MoxR-like ATPase
LGAAVNIAEILTIQKAITNVHIEKKIISYIIQIVSTTRNLPGDVKLGASPRASLALMQTSRALAFLDKRDYVIPDDVKRLSLPVLRHRIILQPRSIVRGLTSKDIVMHILRKVPVPT